MEVVAVGEHPETIIGVGATQSWEEVPLSSRHVTTWSVTVIYVEQDEVDLDPDFDADAELEFLLSDVDADVKVDAWPSDSEFGSLEGSPSPPSGSSGPPFSGRLGSRFGNGMSRPGMEPKPGIGGQGKGGQHHKHPGVGNEM